MPAAKPISGTDKTNRNKRVMVKEIMIGPSAIQIFSGTAVTRAAVRALVGDTPPIGSLFVGSAAVATTKPNAYIKMANGPADTDWERVVTAATD